MKHRLNTLILALNLTLICVFLRESPYFILFLLLAVLLFAVVMSIGVLFMQFNYFLPARTRLQSDLCLISFDDGPDPELTPRILDVLKANDIRALFFVIGTKAEAHPEIVRRIVDEGHLIGNHSYSHPIFMSLYTRNQLREEIDKAQQTLEKIIGYQPQLFRPPIGYTNPRYATVLREKGLHCVGWTLRSYDSVAKEPQKLVARLSSKIRPGMIVLLHDNLPVTADALEVFISESRKNGIKFASPANIKTILNA